MRSLWEGKTHPWIAASVLIFSVLLKRFRSLNAENLGSVGQRAAKLLSVKVGDLKKKSAIRPRPHSNRSAHVQEHPGSNHSQRLMAGNFEALWPADPKFSAFKDLNSCQKFKRLAAVKGWVLPCQSDLIYIGFM